MIVNFLREWWVKTHPTKFLLVFALLGLPMGSAAESVRLYRDTYGIPHIFADSMQGAYFGAGYAVAQDLGWGVSQIALKAEGRQAEFFGRTGMNVEEDIYAHHFHFYKDALEKFAKLSPDAQSAFRAYALGIAACYKTLPGPRPEYAIDVTPEHLAASFLQANFYQSAFGSAPYELKEIGVRLPYPYLGSNAFAIGPRKTSDGSTLHFGGPQTPFGDNQAEIHLQWPTGRVAGYGYGLFMDPGIGLHHCWGSTANWPDTSDAWKLKLDPDNPDHEGFYWDPQANGGKGAWAEMSYLRFTIKIKGERPHSYRRWETPLGPVLRIYNDSEGRPKWAYVWRPSGFGRIEYIDAMLHKQWAPSMREAVAAADPPEAVAGNWILAGDNGDIAFLYNGRIPIRKSNEEYRSMLTAQPQNEWLPSLLTLGGSTALPSVLNPAANFVVSANEAPWFASPSGEIAGREHWPGYVVPNEGWGSQATVRGQRLRDLIQGNGRLITPHEASLIPFDVGEPKALAWIKAWRDAYDSFPMRPALSRDAAEVQRILAEWNGAAMKDSIGMTAAFFLVRELRPWKDIAEAAAVQPPPEKTQINVAAYAKALESVAIKMKSAYGKLDVPWGDIHGMPIKGQWVALGGGTDFLPAIFQAHGTNNGTVDMMDGDGRMRCSQGSAYMAFTRFAPDGTAQRFTVCPGGQHNASVHPDSPHVTDQAELFATEQYKQFYLTEDEVKAHLATDNAPIPSQQIIDMP